jgi:uncharacterized protein (TIGR03067 family)
MKRCALLILTIGLLIAADKKEAKDDGKKLEGDWNVVKGVHGGEEIPEEKVKTFKVTFKGDKFTLNDGEKTHEVAFKLDPAKKPRTIDAMPADGEYKGKTLLGIYSLEGDTLKMCFAEPGTERPKEFTSRANTMHFLLVLKKSQK